MPSAAGPDDPFDTAALRAAVLAAWAASPTRRAEDLAAERDLVTIGYRDRVAAELLQNAADAASSAVSGAAGSAVSDAGRSMGGPGRVRIWHDGTDLHVANTGAALTREGVHALAALRVSAKSGGAVGRFGVGFAAVLTRTDEVQIRSAGGGVAFSYAETARLAGSADVPVLRLPFPEPTAPAAGFATEVVLRRVPAGILDEFHDEARDALLDLSGLGEVSVGTVRYTAPELPTGRGPHARWVIGADPQFLHAPTRTDEPSTLPVRVIADLPVTPDRRRLHPDADVAAAAVGYARFVADRISVEGAGAAAGFLPPSRPPAGGVDARLREAIWEELRTHRWLPAGDEASPSVPARAVVLPGVNEELFALLSPLCPLLPPALSTHDLVPRLIMLGVTEPGWAELTALLPRDREPRWYARLYTELTAAAVPIEELATVPVPLTDGRVVTGARGTVVVPELAADARVSWARVVAPEAVHPLLDRLGARRVSPAELVADDALRAAIGEALERDPDYRDPDYGLTEAVLGCLGTEPAAGPAWLGQLPVPGDDGAGYPADELLLRAAPLRAALGGDHPYGTVEPGFESRFSVAALRAIGAVWTFPVLIEEYPTGPDDTLDGADRWWAGLAHEPQRLVAARDLDLVDHWEPALRLLAALPGVLGDPDGYTAWWLRTHTELGRQRLPDDHTFVGLLDPCPYPDAGGLAAALLTAVRDDADAQVLLDALSDPERDPAPSVILSAYTALAGHTPPRLPRRYRTLDGALHPEPLILDAAHLTPFAGPVVLSGPGTAVDLARTLELPLASARVRAAPIAAGRRAVAGDRKQVVLAMAVGALPVATEVELHDELLVAAGSEPGTECRRVPYWPGAGVLHVDSGLLRALAEGRAAAAEHQ